MVETQNSDQDFTQRRYVLAILYFAIPPTVTGLVWWRIGAVAFLNEPPIYWWRFLYCWLLGFYGLGLRTLYLRHKNLEPYWPEYLWSYPLVLGMNGAAVFTVLTIIGNRIGSLFWTAAVPLCMILGFYCSPSDWLLAKYLFGKAQDS